MRRSRTRPRVPGAAHASPGTLWGKPSPEAGTASGPVQRGKMLGGTSLWLGGQPLLGRRPEDWKVSARAAVLRRPGVWLGTAVSYDPEKGDSWPSGSGIRGYHFMSRASAWPREVQLEPEDRDSFSSQLIKREVNSPHEFSLQY